MNTLAPSRLAAAQLSSLPVVAVDFETYYDSEYSVADSSYWHYVNDPRFRAYLVSIVGPDFTFVGDPKDFDWQRIDGMLWVSHNRAFDKAVYERLVDMDIVESSVEHQVPSGVVCESTGALEYMPEFGAPAPTYWGDTAPLSVFMRAPRSLAGAVQALFGIKRSKEIRNVAMKGKHWEEYGAELQAKIQLYAVDDAADCRRIWVEHIDKWPDHERWIADMLSERGERGFNIDLEALESDITFVKRVKFEAERRIPWAGAHPILSPKAIRAECAKHGLVAPKSMAATDEECALWEEEHGDAYEWIAAVRTYRRANTIISKLEAMRDRTRPDGRMQFQLAYHAAHTGRTGGTGGFNMLNQPRSPFYINDQFGILHKKEDIGAVESYRKNHVAKANPAHIIRAVDFRSKLIASPGGKLVIGDLAQIEPRGLRWLIGDIATLKLIEQGFNPYEAHAKRFMNFTGKNMKKTDPAGYQLAKARELALGYLVGWHKFITMARMYVDDVYFAKIFGAPTTKQNRLEFVDYISNLRNKVHSWTYKLMWERADEFTKNTYVNSWMQVMDFRRKNPELMAFANMLRQQFESSVGEDYELGLPSGRTLTYFDVTKIDDGYQARTERGGPFSYFHAGVLIENATSALARDVFIMSQIRAEDAGLNVLLDVYDELVCDEPLHRNPDDLLRVMRGRPSWAQTLPLDAEVTESPFYCK